MDGSFISNGEGNLVCGEFKAVPAAHKVSVSSAFVGNGDECI